MLFQSYNLGRVSVTLYPPSEMDPTYCVNFLIHDKNFLCSLISCLAPLALILHFCAWACHLVLLSLKKKTKLENAPRTVHGLTLMLKARAHINLGFMEDFNHCLQSCLPDGLFCTLFK